MKKILLTSHGRMALGLKDTLEFFLGHNDDILAISAYLDSSDKYLQEIQTFINSIEEEEAIIFTDIYGGSVNQQVTSLVLEAKKNIPIITSMNLPIVLSLAMMEEEITSKMINDVIKDCTPKLMEFENVDNQEEGGELDAFLL